MHSSASGMLSKGYGYSDWVLLEIYSLMWYIAIFIHHCILVWARILNTRPVAESKIPLARVSLQKNKGTSFWSDHMIRLQCDGPLWISNVILHMHIWFYYYIQYQQPTINPPGGHLTWIPLTYQAVIYWLRVEYWFPRTLQVHGTVEYMHITVD